MAEALREAEEAGRRGDRPIGAVVVHKQCIIARGSSRNQTGQSDVAHAENTAIFACAPYLQQYGRECILYTTVEPCVMCLGTIILANIRSIVFGVTDEYMQMAAYIQHSGYIRQRLHYYLGGVLAQESIALLEKYSKDDSQIILTGKPSRKESPR